MADKKYITTKYGTKIDVTGLSTEQVTKVRSMAEDKGAYGAKGAALADTFRKTNAKTVAKPVPTATAEPVAPIGGAGQPAGPVVQPQGGGSGYVGPPKIEGSGAPEFLPEKVPDPVSKTGALDVPKASSGGQALASDAAKVNFLYDNPANSTDALGNKRSIIQNPDGTVTITDEGGQPLKMTTEAFMKAVKGVNDKGPLDLSGDAAKLGANGLDLSGAPKILETGDVRTEAEKAADANYGYITKNYSRQKQQEMEAAKQELAERGIPLDASRDSLYGKTLESIDQKYQDLDDQAKMQAITKGNETLTTLISGQKTASDAFMDSATKKHDAAVTDFDKITGAKISEHDSGIKDVTTLGSGVSTLLPGFTPYQGSDYSDQSGNYTSLVGMSVDQIMTKYGIDRDEATKRLSIAKSGSGSGKSSGGTTDTSPIIGGSAPGFGV